MFVKNGGAISISTVLLCGGMGEREFGGSSSALKRIRISSTVTGGWVLVKGLQTDASVCVRCTVSRGQAER